MPKKVLWASDYKILDRQIEAIKRYFGNDADIGFCSGKSSEEIAELFREGNYDAVIAFTSWELVGGLCEQGIHPWFPVMKRVRKQDSWDVKKGGRYFNFVEFRQVKEAHLEFFSDKSFS